MEKIVPFDEIVRNVPGFIVPQDYICKINELLCKKVNEVAGRGVDPQFYIDFTDDPHADDEFPMEYRVAIINMLEEAGYSRINEYGHHTVFRLPLAAKTLLPEVKYHE